MDFLKKMFGRPEDSPVNANPEASDFIPEPVFNDKLIENAIAESMDLTPRGIRTHLGLNKPIYQRTAAYGHFGRSPESDGGFSWERTDLVSELSKNL